LNERDEIRFTRNAKPVFAEKRVDLQRAWSETTYQMQKLRDNPDCAQEEYDRILGVADPGLSVALTYDPKEVFANTGAKPRIAILREQGVNGQVEMAAAFTQAGFEAVDVHMSDLVGGRVALAGFRGLVACGGFSYGDVLGAGQGWAKSILLHAPTREAFTAFFRRRDAFALGVCNGCQALAALKDLIPGAERWPAFVRNQSEQFEGRLVAVRVERSPSIFFSGMEGSVLPVPVAHGEGYASFAAGDEDACRGAGLVSLRFADGHGEPALRYPENPNGSPDAITAVTTPDGRVTALMPHPERAFRTVQHSFHPRSWGERSPLARMFSNARAWVG
jgi:phosphoribosylformylglycinamidine synthase